MKKKVILLSVAALMVAALAVGGTLAYLTDTETVTNTFTIGDVEGVISENGDPDEQDDDGDNLFVDWDDEDGNVANDAEDIAPGQKVQKAPVVTNTGVNDAYVRLTITGADDGTGTEYFTIVGLNDGTTDDKWTIGTDGKYYYNSAITTDESTTALFTAVQLKPWVVSGPIPPVEVLAELIQANYLGENVNTPQKAFALYDNQPTAPSTDDGDDEEGSEGEDE
jgi:predicted ribosomally synthesized peptide with SipW-like signal peptide